MRRFLILFSLGLGLAVSGFAAETLTLSDGTTVSGDIVKFDDNGVMIHTSGDAYPNVSWAKFTQEALKQLSANPKIKPLVEPFIAPTESTRMQKPEVHVKEVARMQRPENPSILGGLVNSSVGWFILLVVYAANLYAAFEIAIVRGKSVGAALGLSAVLPLIGPVFFLTQPIPTKAELEAAADEAAAAGPAPGSPEASNPNPSAAFIASPAEKKPQTQAYARGKFTFNKRFIETKFAGFIGEIRGEAKTFAMEVKTVKATLAVERIMQVGATEVILATPNGQVAVPFVDIQEIKLNPKAI